MSTPPPPHSSSNPFLVPPPPPSQFQQQHTGFIGNETPPPSGNDGGNFSQPAPQQQHMSSPSKPTFFKTALRELAPQVGAAAGGSQECRRCTQINSPFATFCSLCGLQLTVSPVTLSSAIKNPFLADNVSSSAGDSISNFNGHFNSTISTSNSIVEEQEVHHDVSAPPKQEQSVNQTFHQQPAAPSLKPITPEPLVAAQETLSFNASRSSTLLFSAPPPPPPAVAQPTNDSFSAVQQQQQPFVSQPMQDFNVPPQTQTQSPMNFFTAPSEPMQNFNAPPVPQQHQPAIFEPVQQFTIQPPAENQPVAEFSAPSPPQPQPPSVAVTEPVLNFTMPPPSMMTPPNNGFSMPQPPPTNMFSSPQQELLAPTPTAPVVQIFAEQQQPQQQQPNQFSFAPPLQQQSALTEKQTPPSFPPVFQAELSYQKSPFATDAATTTPPMLPSLTSADVEPVTSCINPFTDPIVEKISAGFGADNSSGADTNVINANVIHDNVIHQQQQQELQQQQEEPQLPSLTPADIEPVAQFINPLTDPVAQEMLAKEPLAPTPLQRSQSSSQISSTASSQPSYWLPLVGALLFASADTVNAQIALCKDVLLQEIGFTSSYGPLTRLLLYRLLLADRSPLPQRKEEEEGGLFTPLPIRAVVDCLGLTATTSPSTSPYHGMLLASDREGACRLALERKDWRVAVVLSQNLLEYPSFGASINAATALRQKVIKGFLESASLSNNSNDDNDDDVIDAPLMVLLEIMGGCGESPTADVDLWTVMPLILANKCGPWRSVLLQMAKTPLERVIASLFAGGSDSASDSDLVELMQQSISLLVVVLFCTGKVDSLLPRVDGPLLLSHVNALKEGNEMDEFALFVRKFRELNILTDFTDSVPVIDSAVDLTVDLAPPIAHIQQQTPQPQSFGDAPLVAQSFAASSVQQNFETSQQQQQSFGSHTDFSKQQQQSFDNQQIFPTPPPQQHQFGYQNNFNTSPPPQHGNNFNTPQQQRFDDNNNFNTPQQQQYQQQYDDFGFGNLSLEKSAAAESTSVSQTSKASKESGESSSLVGSVLKGITGKWFSSKKTADSAVVGAGDNGSNGSGNGTPKVADLGNENSFYFDESLGRWIDRTADPSESQAAAVPPPPPLAVSATPPPPIAGMMGVGSGVRGGSASSIRSRYVDPFNIDPNMTPPPPTILVPPPIIPMPPTAPMQKQQPMQQSFIQQTPR